MSYLNNVGYEADVFLSVLTGGERDTTVSLRAAKEAQKHNFRGLWPSCLLCRWLSLTVERGHCQNTLANMPTKPAAAIRAAAMFAVVLGLIGGVVWCLF